MMLLDKYAKVLGGAVLAALVLTLCILPGLWHANFGINVFDEPYQVLAAKYPDTNPYAPLSNRLFGFFGDSVGWEMLGFRYLAIGLKALSIFLSGCFLYFKTKKYWMSLAVVALCVLFSTSTTCMPGWDNWTELFVTICLIASLQFYPFGNTWHMLLLGILAGVTAVVRIPNAAIVPLMAVIIYYTRYKLAGNRNALLQSAIFIVTVAATALMILVLMYGSLGIYLETFRLYPIAAHSLPETLGGHINHLIRIGVFMLILWSCYRLCVEVKRRNPKYLFIPLLLTIAVLLYMVFKYSKAIESYVNVLLIGIAFMLFAIIIIVYNHKIYRTNHKLLSKVIIILLLSLTPAIGSNTGLIKIMLYPVIPLLVLYLYRYAGSTIKMCTLAVAVFVLISNALSIFCGKISLKEYSARVENGYLAGVYLQPHLAEQLTEIQEAFSPYCQGDYNVIVMRDGCEYLWEYLFMQKNLYLSNRFDHKLYRYSPEYDEWLRDNIDRSERPVAVLYFKHSTYEPGDFWQLPYLPMLDEKLDIAVEADRFFIFTDKPLDRK